MPPSTSERDTVVVTGFGPFKTHPINASWEAVKLLPHLFNSENLGINLVIEEIPVEYEKTITRLQNLWEEHKPLLMVHVGVSHLAKKITLELCASKYGYKKPDVKGEIPPQTACCIGEESHVTTNLDIDMLVKELNHKELGVSFCSSDNAGLYLCEFSYYTSLCLNRRNSLFVHVPDIGKPYQSQETAHGINEVIHLAVAHVRQQSAAEEGSTMQSLQNCV